MKTCYNGFQMNKISYKYDLNWCRYYSTTQVLGIWLYEKFISLNKTIRRRSRGRGFESRDRILDGWKENRENKGSQKKIRFRFLLFKTVILGHAVKITTESKAIIFVKMVENDRFVGNQIIFVIY